MLTSSESIKELISAISIKHHGEIEVYPPASIKEIEAFEQKIGFRLPSHFREFYSICNGFSCDEDIFNFIPIGEIMNHQSDYGRDWFYFSEYMIFSDTWGIKVKPGGEYVIFNPSDENVVLGESLHEFLKRFLMGNVFDEGGLYDWHKEKGLPG